LLQRRILLLSFRGMVGRRFRVHGGRMLNPATEYAKFSDELLRRKVNGGEEIPRWLVGDHGALVEALRREKAWGRMRCEPAGGERPGYI
jgi:hypothetical protein